MSQNCPFQSSFTQRIAQFTQGIPHTSSSVIRAVFYTVKLHRLTYRVWGLKTYDGGCSTAGIVSSNPNDGMDVCHLRLLRVV